MPIVIQPQFGSYLYESNDATVEEWGDEPSYRSAVTPIPRSDIASALDGYLGPRTISVRGVIGPDGGGTRDQLRTAVDAFMQAHRPGFRQLYRDTDRYLTAQVQSLTVGDDTGLGWVKYALRFEAPNPYWHATAADSDTWNSPLTGATRVLANGGAATALPIFSVAVMSAGTLNLTLTNNTTGKSLGIAALPVSALQSLVVDCAAQTVKLAGSNRMSYFTGEFWKLDPGSNTVQLTLSGVALTSIVTSWVKRWL